MNQKVKIILSPHKEREAQWNYRDQINTCLVSAPKSKVMLDKPMDLSSDLTAKNLKNRKRIKLNIGERRLSNESADDDEYMRSDLYEISEKSEPSASIYSRSVFGEMLN